MGYATSRAALIMLGIAVLCWAQGETHAQMMKQPRGQALFVRSADPAVVTVYQGRSQQVVLHGAGFQAVTGAQVTRNGMPVPGVEAQLGTTAGIRTSSDTDMIITVRAEASGAPGEDYTLRLRSRETTYDVSSSALTVKVWVMHPPRITALWINNHEEATKNPSLSLNHEVAYPATHYRACANWQSFGCIELARWQSYQGSPIPFSIEPLCNYYKVYLQLKHATAEEARVGERALERVVLRAQSGDECLARGVERLEPAAIDRPQGFAPLHGREGGALLGARLGEEEPTGVELEHRQRAAPGHLPLRRAPPEPAGDHEVDHEEAFPLEREHDPLAESLDPRDTRAHERIDRRRHGTHEEGTLDA